MQMKTYLRRAQKASRNWPVMALGAALVVALEAYSVLGIVQTVTAHVDVFGQSVPLALIESSVSLSFGLLSFAMMAAAAALASDTRPDQKGRAFWASCAGLALLYVPITNLAKAYGFQAQIASAREYRASEAYAADVAIAQDRYADSMARREAAANLERAIIPQHARLEFGWLLWAAFLHGSVMLAVRAGWRPAPETPAECAKRLREAAAAKAAATREKNKKAAEKAQRQTGNVFDLKARVSG